VPPLRDWANTIFDVFAQRKEKLICEPGRRMVADAGVLVTRVVHLKENPPYRFAIVDAAMNDLMRPALYDAYHPIENVRHDSNVSNAETWNIVGPICETSDTLGKARRLSLKQNDLLAIGVAGAYGASMSSNYNARPRVCEIMVDGDKSTVIRERERVEDLWRGEHIIDS
jgi:diaminopimelate decarboxylase